MKFRLKWFIRALHCLLTGHKDIVVSFNPVTGERCLGFLCARCGRPKLTFWEFMMERGIHKA